MRLSKKEALREITEEMVDSFIKHPEYKGPNFHWLCLKGIIEGQFLLSTTYKHQPSANEVDATLREVLTEKGIPESEWVRRPS